MHSMLKKISPSLFLFLVSFGIPHKSLSVPPSPLPASQPEPLSSNPPQPPSASVASESQVSTPVSPGHPSNASLNKLADVELKIICGLLPLKDINNFLVTSRQCQKGVDANSRTGLATFIKGRTDTLLITKADQLKHFLSQGTRHFYARGLEVSIRSKEELDLLFHDEHLQKSLTSLTLHYIAPFNGEEHKENLAELIKPFKNLKVLQITGTKNDEPTAAFSFIKGNNLDAFTHLLLKEPKLLIVRNNIKYTVANFADGSRNWPFMKALAQHAPQTLESANEYGRMPPHNAARSDNLEVLRILAHYTPKSLMLLDANGKTPAHWAAFEDKLNAIVYLAKQAPESLKMLDQLNETPAHIALSRRKWRIVNAIAQFAPESMEIQNREGWTPARQAAGLGKWDIVKAIAEFAPKSISVQDNQGRTPTHMAANTKKWADLKFLAEHAPMSLGLPDIIGQTVLAIAKKQGAPSELIQFLEQLSGQK